MINTRRRCKVRRREQDEVWEEPLAPFLTPASAREEEPVHMPYRKLLGFGGYSSPKKMLEMFQGLFPGGVGSYEEPIQLPDRAKGGFLSSEEMHSLVEQCATTHVLLPAPLISFSDLYREVPQFFDNEDDGAGPWFCAKSETWHDHLIQSRWILVPWQPPQSLVGTDMSTMVKRCEKNDPRQVLIDPVTFAFAAMAVLHTSQRRLCFPYVIRFPVQSNGGRWVHAAWFDERLRFWCWDEHPDEWVAALPAFM